MLNVDKSKILLDWQEPKTNERGDSVEEQRKKLIWVKSNV